MIGLAYWGLSVARNCDLIQPFKRVFSTWTQSPSRPVAVNCVPLWAVPSAGAFPEGPDLMLTPGRCKKTRSGFCAVELVWGVTLAGSGSEAAAVSAAGTSAAVGGGCTCDSTSVDATGTACAASAGGFAPSDARKEYANTATPNTATIAVPAISFPRLGSGARKASSSPNGARGGAQSSAGMLRLSSAK